MQIQISLLLDRSRTDTLTQQLAGQLRDAIRAGRIAPGVRLPSSRRLSEQLGIGRNTVVRAYETLEMECFVESRPASGMYAAMPPADPRLTSAADLRSMQGVREPGGQAVPTPRVLRPIAQAAVVPSRGRLSFDFAPGQPNAGLFPLKTWRRLLQSCLSQNGSLGLVGQADPCGLATLRSAIANHIGAARGIVAEPGQIIIVSGVREALAIAARLLLTPGSLVCTENPGQLGAATVFQAAGAELVGVPVDAEGIIAGELPERRAALVYVTPSHQFPTGQTMSPERRGQLIGWIGRFGGTIIEDDSGAEFRYEGGAPQAIAAHAPDRTIYLCTFSQTLGAGLCLGYMVVPTAMVDAVRGVKALLNSGNGWLEQATVAEMIRTGSYASHVLRMRLEYRERRDRLLEALRRNFGDPDISGEAGGLHLFWQLPPGVPDASTVEALGRRARVGVYSLDSAQVWHAGPGLLSRRGLMLGYAALTGKQIEQGIARLSDAVDDALDGRAIGLNDLLVHRPSPTGRGGSAQVRGRAVKPAPRIRQQPALPVGASHRAASAAGAEQRPGTSMMLKTGVSKTGAMTGGTMTTGAAVTGLYHYPIKGLSPQPVRCVRVRAGQPFPFDRVFALARPGVAVTADDPKWAKKGLFVMLMLDEGLARVRTWLDERTLRLTVQQNGRVVMEANLGDDSGRRDVEAFFHDLAPTLRSAPVLVRARDERPDGGPVRVGHFMDKPDNVISLINLATIRSLEQQWGYPIDPLRFRANIYIDGAPAWAEFDWVGSDIALGDAIFRVDRRNGRCGATNVDPATGRRDLDIPGSLRKAFGHKDLGIYLVARNDADLAVDDAMGLPGAARPASAAVAAAAPVRNALICRGCYFIYSEAQGVPANGIPAGTRFADLPASWQCPDCGTDKSAFRPHVVLA